MTGVLYVLAVLTPLLVAGASLLLAGVRWVDRRAEDRVRAEHGLPPRERPTTTRIEDVERTFRALPRGLRRPAGRRRGAAGGQTPSAELPWPLQDVAGPVAAAAPDDREATGPVGAGAAPEEPEPPEPPEAAVVPESAAPEPLPAAAPAAPTAREAAHAALERAAATLAELERAAEQAERYGTKDCPACARSVRLSARVCPHCGHRMAPEPDVRPDDVTAA
ncbi:zinc ribbon domain-containing protein [Paraconexibacter algicola]|uniref:Uncharacterized protein n=1 Tax=Paraconexibacter algicola TaxID=2133960 RepID=A0A2T4UDP1_9ACTN|nr:zinc ribbon domain-containing protein [Paraconexibacter algicola]PTL55627.1 hypothetical protein C7Y72_18505 [Paraconexibacter algicola]